MSAVAALLTGPPQQNYDAEYCAGERKRTVRIIRGVHVSFRKSTIWSTIVAAISIIVILGITIVNVRGLTESVQERTYRYVRDVSEQSAQVIDERFTGRINSLQLIGDSLASSSVINDEEYLGRKLYVSEFEALSYVWMDGSALTVDRNGTVRAENIMSAYADSAAFQETLEGKTTAGFFGDYVAFMVPVTAAHDSEIKGIMIGIRTKESLQSLLVNDAFNGSGFTFIVDQYGEILAEPMDEADYKALSSLMHSVLDDDLHATLVESADAQESADSLEYAVDTPGGTTLVLDYQPLQAFGWTVVTAVNENFLAEVVNEYVLRIVVTLVIFTIIFAVLLFLLLFMQRRYQKRVEAVAFVDSLTGGMSFIRFRMLSEPLIAKNDAGTYALATLNVKRFKLINRIGGSREGDDVLRRIYDVIQSNLTGPDEMVAHSTADNFVLLLRNDGEDVLAQRLKKIAQEIESLQTVMPIRISEGVYVTTADPDLDLIMLLDRSNSARVSATQEYSSTCVFYDDNFVEKQAERTRMIGMIEDGLREHQFSVYLQPKVSPVTNRIAGSEALVRWNHPTRGMIGPNIFIPLAEQHGLICDLDLYVFDKVCEEIRKWQDNGWDVAPVSVNVSGLHLKDPDFVKKYRDIADKHGVDPSLIELELTESIMFSDLETLEARSVINSIHEYGFRCSMDDFGSGYSALGLLTDLPIDCIKLDRSFFLDFVGNPRAQTVVATIIKLAQELDIATVAEGIEMKEQVEMLRDMGVDMIQGFYYSRPLPMKDFEDKVYGDDPTFHGSDA